MHAARFAVLLAAVFALSACYASDTPLIPVDKAVFPFERITYEAPNSDRVTLVRKGDAYETVETGGQQPNTVLFMPVAGDLYVAEVTSADKGVSKTLHALIQVDMENKTVRSYATNGEDKDAGPGLSLCDDGICVADLDAYIDHARAQIAAGAQPDVVYTIVDTE